MTFQSPVRFFSTNTTFIRFISLIVYQFYRVQRKDNRKSEKLTYLTTILLLISMSVRRYSTFGGTHGINLAAFYWFIRNME